MMASIVLFDPGDVASVQLDWSDALDVNATLQGVSHTLPAPLVKVGEAFNDTVSSVGIRGATHGALYMVEAQATLSTTNPDGTPQILNRQFPIRGWNS